MRVSNCARLWVYRQQEPPPEGGMSELLWSDPVDCTADDAGGDDPSADGDGEGSFGAAGKLLDEDGWAPSSRGAGLLWGKVRPASHTHTASYKHAASDGHLRS